MEYRKLGASGFLVPALSFGTGTFGGGNEFFKAWGASDVAKLDAASAVPPPYPYWHQRGTFIDRNPPAV